jgi:hypothetical protein
MATDPTQTLVPQLARVWLAPVGTTAPDGPVITMPTGWRDVGLFTPDSLNWATDPNFEEVRSHQSYYAVRRFQTTDSATLEVDLQEWSGDNLIAVYGGGTIETVTPSGGGTDYYRFSPPAIGGRQAVAACIEIVDNDTHWRRLIPPLRAGHRRHPGVLPDQRVRPPPATVHPRRGHRGPFLRFVKPIFMGVARIGRW